MASHNPRTSTTRQRAFALRAAAAITLALPCAALAQTVQLVNQPFPLTAVGLTTTLALPLNIGNAGTIALSAQIAPGFPEYTVTGITGCGDPSASLPAGTTCQININFTPQLPGQATSPVPFGHSALLTVSYSDVATNAFTNTSFVLTGTATGPWPVLVPGIVSVLAGDDSGNTNSGFAGEGGPATAAAFNIPGPIAVDSLGNIYIADSGNNVVRVVYEAGTIPNVANPAVGNIYTIAGVTPFAGASTAGPGTDNVPAIQSALNNPQGLAIDQAGNLYISDSNNNAIRKVNAITGIITTVAGTLNSDGGYAGDNGPAIAAHLASPAGISIDGNGNLYIADAANNAVREVIAATGNIATVAGGNSPATDSDNDGDGGPATLASLNLPLAVITDSAFDIYIADSQHHSLRRVDGTTGIISTPAQDVSGSINSVAVDSADNIYFSDTVFCSVQKYSPFTQLTNYVAGNNLCITSGDGGAATAAGFRHVSGIAVGKTGGLLLMQTDSLRYVDGTQTLIDVGKVAADTVAYPSVTLTPMVSNLDIVSLANPGNPPWTYYTLDVGAPEFFSILSPFFPAPYKLTTQQTPDCGANISYQSLLPGQSCGFSFYAEPIADGTVTQVSQLSFGGHSPSTGSFIQQPIPADTVTFSVTGTGNFNQLQFNPAALSFGSVAQNATNSTLPVTLSNPGMLTINISRMYFTDPGFSIANSTCGGSLPPMTTCVVNVTFAPGANDFYQSQLVVVTDDIGSPHELPLSGNGPLEPYFTPSYVNFAPIVNGVGGDPGTVTFTNPTPYPLQVTSINVFGYTPNIAMIVTSTTCTGTIAPASSCTINLNFSSTYVGLENGVFSIYVSGLPADYPSTYQVGYAATGTGSVAQLLQINETIDTKDAPPMLVESTILPINETIDTSDSAGTPAALKPSTILPIYETIDASDSASAPSALQPSTILAVNETITSIDAPSTAANQIGTAITVNASASPIALGSLEMFVIRLSPGGAPGTVSLYDGFTLLATLSPSNGLAIYSTYSLAAGVHSFHAVYAGNATYNASTSPTARVVVQAPLTITAQSASRSFDTINPSFTYTASGFVNGDTAASLTGTPNLTTTAQLNSPAGTYPITITQGTLAAPSYYAYDCVDGTLTVQGNVVQTITFLALPAQIVHTFTKVTLTASSSSGLPVTYQVSGPANIDGNKLTFNGTGAVKVTALQAFDPTFNSATPVVRSFEVQ